MSKLKIKNILIIEHIKKYFVFYIFSTKGHWKAWQEGHLGMLEKASQ